MKHYITFAKTSNQILPYEETHRQVAYRAATEGIVLLENDGTLPLTPGKVALYGAGAGHTIKGGTGSGEVNERHSETILEGLEAAGFQVTTRSWINDYTTEYEQGLKAVENEIKASLKKLDIRTYMSLFLKSYRYPYGRQITLEDVKESETDTCIYVVARQSGEGSERRLENNDFELSLMEKENIRFLTEHYEKTIVVLNIGSSFDTGFLKEIPGINALIYLCQPGTAGGSAFADLLSGKVTPSGKLTDTWVKSYEDVPFGREYSYLNGNLQDEDYKEDIYVGYRYYDTFGVEPAYPFGYGLSYTSFQTTYCSILRDGDTISLKAAVQNTGPIYSGKEVVQLYVSAPKGSLPKEYQRLCAFAKTGLLSPGQEEEITLTFPLSGLASFRQADSAWILESGDYLLRLGPDSRHTRICARLSVPEEICVSRHKPVCPLQEKMDVLTHNASSVQAWEVQETVHDLDCLTILPEYLTTSAYNYQSLPVCKDEIIKKQLKDLTMNQRIDLVVGAGLKDMLLNSSFLMVPGVAGNTTSTLLHKGIVNIALSDGPAGLRLQRRFTITRQGTAKMIDMQLDMMKHFPEPIKKLFCGNPDKDTVYYQFTTAFPVAALMAQTWNEALLEEMGHAVGEEMKEYGVTFWLAPGLNIHRNPLCGRNFEYYSEDPLVSGKMAAAITRGVQKHPGCFVTLKHFCANNQEENRDYVSSNLTERALREIYLRGFEIALREGNARGLMTSYNRLNGTYTSNSKDLLIKVLRQEWGFDGLVMTDWTTTAGDKSDPVQCMEAGNDLIMPGSLKDKLAIRKAIKNGTLSPKSVNRCAANVLKAIRESAFYDMLSGT